jgi:hypothetical protein
MKIREARTCEIHLSTTEVDTCLIQHAAPKRFNGWMFSVLVLPDGSAVLEGEAPQDNKGKKA